MEKQDTDILEVKDIALASYLYTIDIIKFIGQKRQSNGTVFFQFAPKDIAEKLIIQYWDLKAPSIQPKKLFNAQRDLKDIIFSS